MGSSSSGNHGGKNCTDDYRALDVRRLAGEGLLTPGHSFGWNWMRNGEKVASIQIWPVEADRVRLNYRHKPSSGEWQDMDYPVRLAHTPCNLGGDRAWWRCPAAGCGRRVAVLYLGRAGIFACRHCYRLGYRSQRETPDDRAARRANKVRARLGWDAGILNFNGGKPKGMHWSTYERQTASHALYVNQALAGISAKLGLVMGRHDRINL